MKPKIVGSILVILGTSIGAGMLALPVATAQQNFTVTVVMLLLCWTLMTAGALSLLEVNLWFKPGSNIVSMAKETLGFWGKAVAWFVYFLLLYSLICAYLSGTGDVLHALLREVGLNVSRSISTILSLLILGSIVYTGIGSVDSVNRVLMSVKLLAFFLLVLMIMPFVHSHLLQQGGFHWHANTLMVIMTSFGYAIIVPSLRTYLNSDIVSLKKIILIGSALPLFIYLIWIVVIQGVLHRGGAHGLLAILHSSNANSLLLQKIAMVTHYGWLAVVAKIFVSICVVTSFLCVSVCLMDFLADGLAVKKQGLSGLGLVVGTYSPPLIIVLLFPGIFIHALSYAGICCVALLILLPIIMLYVGRYQQLRAQNIILPGGRLLPIVIFLIGLFCFFTSFLS